MTFTQNNHGGTGYQVTQSGGYVNVYKNGALVLSEPGNTVMVSKNSVIIDGKEFPLP